MKTLVKSISGIKSEVLFFETRKEARDYMRDAIRAVIKREYRGNKERYLQDSNSIGYEIVNNIRINKFNDVYGENDLFLGNWDNEKDRDMMIKYLRN